MSTEDGEVICGECKALSITGSNPNEQLKDLVINTTNASIEIGYIVEYSDKLYKTIIQDDKKFRKLKSKLRI